MFSDPLTLFRAAVDAINRGDWAAAAALCDPASLTSFRRQMVETYSGATQRVLGVDDLLRLHPDMPREVAAYQAADAARHADPARRLRHELAGVSDVDALRALDAAAVFAAWLDGRSMRTTVARMLADGEITPATAEETLAHAHDVWHYVALGVVPDGDRIAHVVYRHDVDAEDAENAAEDADGDAAAWDAALSDDERALQRDLRGHGHPYLATCRRQPDGTWRLLGGHDFLSLGSAVFFLAPEDPALDEQT